MPTGGYRHAATAAAASAAVLTSGTMMPYAPTSSAFMIMAGSFHGTRTTGTVSVCEIACIIGKRLDSSLRPCCRSTQSASKPWRAMTSAVKLLGTESQPSVTHFPSRQICLILFVRTVVPPVIAWRRASCAPHQPGRLCDTIQLQPLIVGRYAVAGHRRREPALRTEREPLQRNH